MRVNENEEDYKCMVIVVVLSRRVFMLWRKWRQEVLERYGDLWMGMKQQTWHALDVQTTTMVFMMLCSLRRAPCVITMRMIRTDGERDYRFPNQVSRIAPM